MIEVLLRARDDGVLAFRPNSLMEVGREKGDILHILNCLGRFRGFFCCVCNI